MNFKLIFLALVVQLFSTKCDDVVKSSLTFVIDDTGSMSNDIAQVKEGVNLIFDTVMESKYSQIENFVLVTFNDPLVRPPTVTRDRVSFKLALNNIIVDGGGDCPENSMSGIEVALKESLPGSYLYVFTDASAKDFEKYEQVKSLAQKKSSQIVFVLTGRCDYNDLSPDYVVYENMAHATSGQVFLLGKTDVRKILDYVIESIRGRTTVLSRKEFEPGYGKDLNFTTDEHIPFISIALSGDKPKIDVTGPKGDKAAAESLVDTSKVSIVVLKDPESGVYTAKVGSMSKTTVVVSGRTTIDFQYGFSTFIPLSITDTATRPQRDVKSYLSIKLNVIEGGDVKLTHVKILDLDGNTLLEAPLEVLNEKDRLYATRDPIESPNKMFRIMMVGYSVADNSTVTRLTPTSIEPQNPELEPKENRPPKITIVGTPKVTINYGEPLKLSCKVNAYPEPEITWQQESSETILSSMVAAVEPPYEYISVLEIEKVSKSSTYTCKASNTNGVDSQTIDVEVPIYFNILETPKDTIIKYNTSETIPCKIDASPAVNITWYKDGNILEGYDEISVSPDGSVLTVLNMQALLQGKYECKVENGIRKESFKFKVDISGVEAPKFDKHVNTVRAPKGSDPELICRLTAGIPAPKFIWFYKSNRARTFTRLRGVSSNSIKFNNLDILKSGAYKCVGYNEFGQDEHTLELIVEYPPTIKNAGKKINGRAGDTITLKCAVDAIPSPVVQWTKDDVPISDTPTTRIYGDHSLELKLSPEESGTYKCMAGNYLGKYSIIIQLEVYIPAYIEPLTESKVHLKVGDDVNLECNADGLPKPDVKWTISNALGEVSTISIRPGDSTAFNLVRAQLNNAGYYTCIATNPWGSSQITYDVKVNAPPEIVNIYPDKTFRAIEGDLVLTIKCNATGSPKPVITWTKDGLNVASGTPWYDTDEYGTLMIKNVDTESIGIYVCRAENSIGRDTELFYVEVDPYPRDEPPTSVVQIEEGSSKVIECNIPHNMLDSVRWYKDRRLLTSNKVSIINAKPSDAGLYVCRVSDFSRSLSGYMQVVVGYKPRFRDIVAEDVDLVEGYIAELDCAADAYPPAKTMWSRNGKSINVTTSMHTFYMTISDFGNYTCEVTNEFGSIQRTFNIRSRDCILSVKDDFNDNQPLMITTPLNWPTYEVVEGKVVIPNGDYFNLECPDSFTKFSTAFLTAYCDGVTNFTIEGKSYEYTDLKCTSDFDPGFISLETECYGEGSDQLMVEFDTHDDFLLAYDICFNKNNLIPHYIKHNLDRHIADEEPKNKRWLKNDLLRLDLDEMFDCDGQIAKISDDLGKPFHASDRCCFRKRQLINPRDMAPGLRQISTFTNFNVVPHWSTCNTNNWDELEEKLRKLAKSIDYPLTVWTGTYGHLELPDASSNMKPIYIYDSEGNKQSVPLYLWKVVQDPITRSSLAIVQVNVPDLQPSATFDYLLCGDICDDIPWMKGPAWRDVSKGHTFCCNIEDFENAFGYKGIFKRGHKALMKKVSSVSSHYLI